MTTKKNAARSTLTGYALFAKCVEYKLMSDGMVEIHCKLGLWSVAGRDRKQVEREAAHYWQQYYADGEYNSILSNKKLCREQGGNADVR